jgi:hypothetical protein
MNIPIDRKRVFKNMAYLIIPLFLVNYIANKFYWYYSIWYFDMIMHFWGGICLGLALVWFLSYKNLSLELNLKLIFKILLGVLLVGVLWEIYEVLFNNIIAQNPFNLLDTISDLFFDLAGGAFIILFFFKIIMFKKENKVE